MALVWLWSRTKESRMKEVGWQLFGTWLALDTFGYCSHDPVAYKPQDSRRKIVL